MTPDINVLFIDGPWDGRRMELGSHVLKQPSYVVAAIEPVDFSPYDPYSALPAASRFHYSFLEAVNGIAYFAYPSAWNRMYPNPHDYINDALFRGYVGRQRGEADV